MGKPQFITDVQACVDQIIEIVGKKIVFGMPIALGKPNHFVNALYQRAKADPDLDLTICTALGLEVPKPKSDLEARLMDPIAQRLWNGFVDFDYVTDLKAGTLPPNVTISEFYIKAGDGLTNAHTQQAFVCSNYTHAIRDLLDNGLNVFGSLVAPPGDGSRDEFSVSCNPDLVLEALAAAKKLGSQGRKMVSVGQINSNLPYMYGDAVVSADHYDFILEGMDFPLFSVPKGSVAPADHMLGLHVSALIRDGGTLQIGIGSLGDAIAAGLILRHTDNGTYHGVLEAAGIPQRYRELIGKIGGTGTFEQGLYGDTEMLVDVFLKLYDQGVLKRRVYDHVGLQSLLNQGRVSDRIPENILDILLDQGMISNPLTPDDLDFLTRYGILAGEWAMDNGTLVREGQALSPQLDNPRTRATLQSGLGKELQGGVVCHGGFFIGTREFYDRLNAMDPAERKRFPMTGVDVVNQLYGNEELRRLQRRDGRFVNAGMKATLLGAVVSDALENGSVVSGVGGQYNFVAMAHALEDARSIIMIRAVRNRRGKPVSNIVFSYGHTTIPRHLRDIVVTEYGIADLRGKCDRDIVAAMLNIADSRFQEELLAQAKQAKKIEADYQIPEVHRNNTPQALAEKLAPFSAAGHFPAFPFGTDLTDTEVLLARALKGVAGRLQARKFQTLAALAPWFFKSPTPAMADALARMGLDRPQSFKERALRAVVAFGLSRVLPRS